MLRLRIGSVNDLPCMIGRRVSRAQYAHAMSLACCKMTKAGSAFSEVMMQVSQRHLRTKDGIIAIITDDEGAPYLAYICRDGAGRTRSRSLPI